MPSDAPRFRTLLTLGWAGLSLAAAVGYVAWRVHRTDIPGLSPGPGLALNETNFPAGPRLVAERTFRLAGALGGVTAISSDNGPRILVFGSDRMLDLGRDLALAQERLLPAVAQSLENIDVLELGPGKVLIAGTSRPAIVRHKPTVLAFDGDGKLAFAYVTPERARVEGLALLRIGSDWGIAVGYGGKRGLCLLDSNGGEKWCNPKVKRAWAVSTADCNQDGSDEILTNASEAGGLNQLSCHDREGRQTKVLRVPGLPELMTALDLDGDGRKEIAYFAAERNDTHRIGAWRLDGSPFFEAHVADPITERDAADRGKPPRPGWQRWPGSMIPLGARRGPDGKRDLIVLGPRGELLGVAASGARWQAGQDIRDAVAVDLDGDRTDELVTLGRRRQSKDKFDTYVVSIWSWKASGDPVRREITTLAARDPRPTARVEARSRVPIRPFAAPIDDRGPSDEELDFRHGCYTGTGVTLRSLPARSVREPLEAALKRCEDALAALDVSNVDSGTDLTTDGCLAGVTLTRQKYPIPGASGPIATMQQTCLEEARGQKTNKPGVRAASTAQAMTTDAAGAQIWLPTSVATRRRRKADGSLAGAPALPPELDRPGRAYHGSYVVCVSAAGAVTSAKARFPLEEPRLEALWLEDLRASKFEPYRVFDTAIPFCALVHLQARGRNEIVAPIAGGQLKIN